MSQSIDAYRAGRAGRVTGYAAVTAVLLSTLMLTGCGDTAPDPTAKRPPAQADQLRERLRSGQGAT